MQKTMERRAALSWIGLASASAFGAAESPADRIKDLVAAYARSIDAADPALGAKVWSTSADVTFIHPRGHEHGWNEIKSNVYGRLMGGMFSERKQSVRDESVRVFGDAALAEFYWVFDAKLRNGGAAVQTKGRESQVYRKTGRTTWALVHVHYSGMPAAA